MIADSQLCCAWFFRSESEKAKHMNRKISRFLSLTKGCRRLKLLSTKPCVKGCTNA
jgi:hypothetical protein